MMTSVLFGAASPAVGMRDQTGRGGTSKTSLTPGIFILYSPASARTGVGLFRETSRTSPFLTFLEPRLPRSYRRHSFPHYHSQNSSSKSGFSARRSIIVWPQYLSICAKNTIVNRTKTMNNSCDIYQIIILYFKNIILMPVIKRLSHLMYYNLLIFYLFIIFFLNLNLFINFFHFSNV